MAPKEYFKISKETAQPLYDEIEAEIKDKLLTKYNIGYNRDYYELILPDELKNRIESNNAMWEVVKSIYIENGWYDVYLAYNFSFIKKNRKLKISFVYKKE